MNITTDSLNRAVARADAAMATLEQELNQADAVLGDGDTGGMLARVIHGMAEKPVEGSDLGAAFSALAKAALANTGSSLGTLFATALMSMAKATKGQEAVGWDQLSPMLAAARDAMIARGGASLGDKTVLDALDALARSTDGLTQGPAVAQASVAAVHAALEEFRGKPCKVGRARMFAEKSIGIDDPGMLAFAKLTEAVAA